MGYDSRMRRSSAFGVSRAGKRAGRTIWRNWKNYKNRKDKIKSGADVRKAMRDVQPASCFFTNTDSTMSVTPYIYKELSKITFNNSNNTPYARKSTNIRAGHLAVRGELIVYDTTNLCRVMVVRLKDTAINPDAFTPSTMFQYNNGEGTQPDNLYANVNTRICEVKYDRMFQLQKQLTGATRVQSVYLNFKIPFHETWKYMSCENAQNPSTRNTKNYFLVAFSDSTAEPTQSHPKIKLTTCLWFKNISNNA